MNEDLINAVAEKAGLPADKAQAAVDAVLGFLKEHPDQVSGLLGIEAGGGSRLEDAKEKLGDVAEKLGPAKDKVADVGKKASGRIGRLLKRD